VSRLAARFEIKDAKALDKDIEPRHAPSAHPLREIGARHRRPEMPVK
jgi:hypothetical protein